MVMANEKVNKNVRKYRSEYWSTNRVDDDICKAIRDCSEIDQLL